MDLPDELQTPVPKVVSQGHSQDEISDADDERDEPAEINIDKDQNFDTSPFKSPKAQVRG